ncbi:hypothetical protein OY671_009887, partial [Metschnikowia pulcherrima]
DGFIDPVSGASSYYKGGMSKILAVTSEARSPNSPDVPTVGEVSPGYQYYSWYGSWAPAGTPAPIVEKLNAEVNKASSSGMAAKYEQSGVTITPITTAEFTPKRGTSMSTDPTPGHAVVTGATGGIGQAIVQRSSDGGWRVTGSDLGPAVARHAAYRHVEVDSCDDAATRQASQASD